MPETAPTIWPAYITDIEPDVSESPVAAARRADTQVQPPDPRLPADKARWSGEWSGWACEGRLCDLKLTVESVRGDGATIVYSTGSAQAGAQSQRLKAIFTSNELHATLSSGVKIVFRMRTDGIVELVGNAEGQIQFGGVLSNYPLAERTIDRIPTPFVENGQQVSLEVVIYKPPGAGPFPAVMFNHGSTGNGDNPALFTSTWSSPALASFFNERGWLVAFPQRRGRGKSGGLYDEGFTLDRSEYSCEPKLSLPGLERALTDIDVAAKYLAGRPDVKDEGMLLGGQSRGGIASIAYAGTHPDCFIGVINFVGRWVDDQCFYAEPINGEGFRRGAPYPKPTLWLYGEHDPFYKISHSRKNFDVFKAAGGTGAFHVVNPGLGQSGHGLVSRPALWREPVQSYLETITGRS